MGSHPLTFEASVPLGDARSRLDQMRTELNWVYLHRSLFTQVVAGLDRDSASAIADVACPLRPYVRRLTGCRHSQIDRRATFAHGRKVSLPGPDDRPRQRPHDHDRPPCADSRVRDSGAEHRHGPRTWFRVWACHYHLDGLTKAATVRRPWAVGRGAPTSKVA